MKSKVSLTACKALLKAHQIEYWGCYMREGIVMCSVCLDDWEYVKELGMPIEMVTIYQ